VVLNPLRRGQVTQAPAGGLGTGGLDVSVDEMPHVAFVGLQVKRFLACMADRLAQMDGLFDETIDLCDVRGALRAMALVHKDEEFSGNRWRRILKPADVLREVVHSAPPELVNQRAEQAREG